MEQVHMIGIGGTGISAIARILHERGYQVSGSDRVGGPLAEDLARLGVPVYIGHNAAHIRSADLVIRSSAVSADNPEVLAAQAAGIPVLNRTEFLPRLLADDSVIAVAGTHGKTTTTAMLAWTLKSLGEDPSYIVGSIPLNLGANAHAGKGRYFVIEADEYDHMFLGLAPEIAVVTMIEYDHPDFFPTPESFFQAFEQFAARIKPGGALVFCSDDPGAKRLAETLTEADIRQYTYGLQRPARYTAHQLQSVPESGYSFEFRRDEQTLAAVSLQVPGEHNVRNALAALAVIDQLHLPVPRAAGALSAYRGSARRFEVVGEVGGVTIIDDYAHHPTEIRATLEAASRRYPGRRLVVVWQPHTYSRTRQLLLEFGRSFAQAGLVVVTDIYPAREMPPADGFSSVDVVNVLQHPQVHHLSGLENAADFLIQRLNGGDVLLVLSAGDADRISRRVLSTLQEPERQDHV
jgi:UDP-N-acetylmuramate--alanine ligase